jgi:hypothetical protein
MDLVVPLIVMPIPTLIAGLVVVKTIQLRKAARWVQGEARITSSKVVTTRHRFQGEAEQVKNEPAVTYEFAVGSETFHGKRISIGETPADGIEAALQRYSTGARVPVFYDPQDPTNAVLERDPPVKLGCLWAGAAIGLLVGAAVTLVFGEGEALDELLQHSFPRIEHPLMSLCVALMGCFCLLIQWGMRRQAAQAATWPVVRGSIVSSKVESFRDAGTRRTRGSLLYRAVVEYAYEVDGRSFRGTRVGFGAVVSSSLKAPAEARAARYVPGAPIDVHVDPADPNNAVLELTIAWNWALTLIALALFGIAAFAALHP